MTEMDQGGVVSAGESTAAERSVLSNLIGVFTSPRETFEALREKPSWLIPFLLICVVSFGSFYLTRDILVETQIERIRNNPAIPDEQQELIIERIEGSVGSSVRQLVIIPISIAVMLLIVSAVLTFGASVMLGGTAKFKQVFSLYTWSSLIGVLAAIIKTPLILATGSMAVATSLAVFMPPDSYTTFLYNFLAKFDVFSIWQVIVVSIGISVVYRFTMRRSLILVGSLWLVYVLISAGLGVLTQGLTQFG
jgi:hypothetical protein